MRKEIEGALKRLEIEGKETRKRTARNILVIAILATIFYLIPYFYPQLILLLVVEAFIGIIGGFYVGFYAISALYQPLSLRFHAFRRIARAIQTLEKSTEPIAYEEAYRCLKHGHKILTTMELGSLEWYSKINETLDRFLDNLESIVLPAVASSSIKIEHLEEIALALYGVNLSEIEEVNRVLESEASYKASKPPPRKTEIFARKLRESTIGKLLYSLGLGYGFVLVLCVIYVFATQQDFMIFARENPEIVVLGGLGISGMAFWKTKP